MNLKRRALVCDEVRQIGAEKHRTLRIIGTDETPDRFNTIIKVDGWKLDNFNRNPVFLWCHDHRQPPIGRILNVEKVERTVRSRDAETEKETERTVPALAFDVQFADEKTYAFADTIYRLYQKKFLRGSSVGFEILKSRHIDDEDELRELGLKGPRGELLMKNELWELSAAPVPANPNALLEELTALAPEGVRALMAPPVDDTLINEAWLQGKLEAIRAALPEPAKGYG